VNSAERDGFGTSTRCLLIEESTVDVGYGSKLALRRHQNAPFTSAIDIENEDNEPVVATDQLISGRGTSDVDT
jgi:hypothetical protein